MNIAACEALATKAEVQELREQINKLLGQPETEGGQNIDVLQSGSLVGTTIGAGLIYGLDIVEEAGGKYVTLVKKNLQGIQKGFEGTKKFLTKTRNMVKNNFGMVKDLAKGRLGLMLDMANLAATMAMYIETLELENQVKGLEFQMLQNDIDYGSLKSILRKTEQDLLAAVGVIATVQDNLNTSIANNEILKGNIVEHKKSITQLENNLDVQEQNILILEQNLDDYQEYAEEEIFELKEYIGELKVRFDKHAKSYGELNIFASKAEIRLTNLEKSSDTVKQEIFNLKLLQSYFYAQANELSFDLDAQVRVNQKQEIKLLKALKLAEEAGGIGASYNTNDAIAQQQNATVGLTSALLGNPPTVKDKDTDEDIPVTTNFDAQSVLQGSTDFSKIFDGLLANVPDITNIGENVTPQQMEQMLADFGTTITNDVNANQDIAVAGAIAALVTPNLVDIKNQTSPASISNAVGSEICNQTANPNSCLSKNVTNPMNSGFKNVSDKLGLGLDAANLALSKAILGEIALVQAFLSKAWNSTFVDKTLNAVNTALAFHNAVMLSRNLGQTVGDTATLFLEAINVQDHNGEGIDVNEWMTAKFTGIAQTLLGADNYETLVKGLNAANRILTAAQGMISALNGIKDALQEGQEIIRDAIGQV